MAGQQQLPAGLKELLAELEDYAPTVRRQRAGRPSLTSFWRAGGSVPLAPCYLQVPDQVTQHALRQSGYDCKDVRT